MLAVFAERGGDPDRPGKRDPLDCLLWQADAAGRAGLGRHRSGAAGPAGTSSARRSRSTTSGTDFDVQGGGTDLVFPHHEMSAAQAQVAFPARAFAQAYVHAGWSGSTATKMSKSLGNLVLVSALRARRRRPVAIRLALLAHHYRTDWEWTDDDLVDGAEAAGRAGGTPSPRRPRPGGDESTVRDVRAALADDLDAPARWPRRRLGRPSGSARVDGVARALMGA